jgi:DNA-binding CsgD family transcriptional regulator
MRADAVVDAVLRRWVEQYGLTGAESALLRAAVEGSDRAEYARVRMVSYATVKKQAQTIIDKTGDESLDRAANRLLRQALDVACEKPP